jgi:hypothetical protein
VIEIKTLERWRALPCQRDHGPLAIGLAAMRLTLDDHRVDLCVECATKVFNVVGLGLHKATGKSVASLAGVKKGKRK